MCVNVKADPSPEGASGGEEVGGGHEDAAETDARIHVRLGVVDHVVTDEDHHRGLPEVPHEVLGRFLGSAHTRILGRRERGGVQVGCGGHQTAHFRPGRGVRHHDDFPGLTGQSTYSKFYPTTPFKKLYFQPKVSEKGLENTPLRNTSE